MRSPTLIALGSELRRYRLAAGNMTQGHLAKLISYVEAEGQASGIHMWDVVVVPGIFQTPEYVRALLSAGRPAARPDSLCRRYRHLAVDVATLPSLRMGRRLVLSGLAGQSQRPGQGPIRGHVPKDHEMRAGCPGSCHSSPENRSHADRRVTPRASPILVQVTPRRRSSCTHERRSASAWSMCAATRGM